MMRANPISLDRIHCLPRAARAALGVGWWLVRVPVYVLLHMAGPVVRLGLGALGLLSFLLALFYHFTSTLTHPPFLPLLGFSLLCGLALLVYEALLRLFS
jgi:hypothetical protein